MVTGRSSKLNVDQIFAENPHANCLRVFLVCAEIPSYSKISVSNSVCLRFYGFKNLLKYGDLTEPGSTVIFSVKQNIDTIPQFNRLKFLNKHLILLRRLLKITFQRRLCRRAFRKTHCHACIFITIAGNGSLMMQFIENANLAYFSRGCFDSKWLAWIYVFDRFSSAVFAW